jgi:hypothetical protein
MSMSRDAESGEGEFKESADRDGSPENLVSHILNREVVHVHISVSSRSPRAHHIS